MFSAKMILFEQLPELVLKKVYDACSNDTKKNLSLAFNGCGRKAILENAGCYIEKPVLFCFCCQFELFYKEFVEDDSDRGTLGLHFIYFFSGYCRGRSDLGNVSKVFALPGYMIFYDVYMTCNIEFVGLA